MMVTFVVRFDAWKSAEGGCHVQTRDSLRNRLPSLRAGHLIAIGARPTNLCGTRLQRAERVQC